MIADGTLIRHTEKWNKLVFSINNGEDLDNTMSAAYRLLRSAYLHLNTEYVENETKRKEFGVYLHAFVKALVACPTTHESWSFSEDRQLALIVLITGIKDHGVWLDSFMLPRDIYITLSNKHLPAVIEKLPEHLQDKWRDKVYDLVFNSKRKNEHFAYLGKDTHAFLNNFKKTILSRWNDYSITQRTYLWCAVLGSIQDDIDQETFILSEDCNRSAIDETIAYFKDALPDEAYSTQALVTNLYLRDKDITIDLIDRLYEQIEKTNTPDNYSNNQDVSLEF